MSLIDSTYFKGPLTIPQLGQAAVADSLNNFIELHEPLMLQAALGYELWLDFVAGLNQPVIDPKWLAIRDGIDYQATGLWPPFMWQSMWMRFYRSWYIPMTPRRLRHWVGFTGGTPIMGDSPSDSPILVLTTGAMADDPVTGTNTFTLDTLAGRTYTIERRGFGTMAEGTDVSITNNGQTITLLKDGDKFNYGEVFIIHFVTVTGSGKASGLYQSPEAAYIYYQWFRDQAGNLSAFGIVQGAAENSKPATGMLKMSDALNAMSKQIVDLWQYLDISGTDVYPSYDRLKIDYNFFKPINQFAF